MPVLVAPIPSGACARTSTRFLLLVPLAVSSIHVLVPVYCYTVGNANYFSIHSTTIGSLYTSISCTGIGVSVTGTRPVCQ